MITEKDILKIIDDNCIYDSDSGLLVTVCKGLIVEQILLSLEKDNNALLDKFSNCWSEQDKLILLNRIFAERGLCIRSPILAPLLIQLPLLYQKPKKEGELL